MRKIICLILAVLTVLPAATVLADDYDTVELEIQLGSYVAFINGETKSIEAPFLKDGVTVAPIEAISGAFGKENSEKVTFGGITIEFSENSSVATVEDEEKALPTEVVRVNGSLMVPVRFVCDTFNALIEYEGETGIVRVSKSADFTDLFDKPVSGYWCDEDYGWMIQLPTEYDHVRNVYDGSVNQFVNSTGDAAFLVSLKKNEYQTIEQLRMYILAQNRGEILRNEEILTLSGGTEACYFEFEDNAAILAPHGDYLVVVEFMTTSKEKFELYREDARRGVKSLTFEIDSALKPENVSTLNEGGFKVYTDKILGFTVNRMESWTEPSYMGNNVSVWDYLKYELLSKLYSDEIFDGQMKVSVFSKEEGDTPELLAEKEKQRILAYYNRKYLHDVELSSYVTNDEACSQLDYTIIYNGRKQINKTKYFVKDDYIYKAEYYVIYSASADESRLCLEEIAEMFDSIRIKGVDASKLGTVIDISRRIDETVMQKYTNQREDFEVSVPAAWITTVSANLVSALNLNKNIEIVVEKLSYLSSLEEAKKYLAEQYPEATFSKDTFAGKTAYKMTVLVPDTNGDAVNGTVYFFAHEKSVYCVAGSIKEVYETAENQALVNKILKSFRLV